MEIIFEGRKFEFPNTKQIEMDDVASKLKRHLNKIVAQNELNKNDVVIDAFAGVGFSSYLYAKQAGLVHCIEKDKEIYNYLERNLQDLNNVQLYCANNLDIFPKLSSKGVKLVDLDPHNNFHSQLIYLPRIIGKGIVLFTSGEILGIRRGFKNTLYKCDLTKYKGKNYPLFAEEILVPYLQERIKELKPNLEYMYIYPSSIRLLFTVGGYSLSSNLKYLLSELPMYLSKVKGQLKLL